MAHAGLHLVNHVGRYPILEHLDPEAATRRTGCPKINHA
jgi:hypothetical protein